MDNDRLEVLLHLYIDEGLDNETRQELEQLLLSSPRAREIFWQRTNLNSMLREQGQESWGREEFPDNQTTLAESTAATRDGRWRWVLALCCVLMVGVTVWLFGTSRLGPDPELAPQNLGSVAQQPVDSPPKTPAWVAVLRKSVNVQWHNDANALNAGEAMLARRIQFESGLVEIQTDRGALITLEGPADLDIVSGMEVLCRMGRLRVDVPPPAIGFLVNTPQVNVVDLGTSFTMDVSAEETTDVHVLKGKVELVSVSPSVPNRELREGQSIGVAKGAYQDVSSDVATFPSVDQVRLQSRSANNRLRQAWHRRREAISNDPSCFVYFDFEQSRVGDTALVNKTLHAQPSTNGTIVGGEWAEGRWPGKKALEFKSVFDRVLFTAPGSHEALTCLASVRLDAMSSDLTSLLMPSSSVEGNFRWQLARLKNDRTSGGLRVGRHTSSDSHALSVYDSEPSFQLEQLGTWVQLAFVWDAANYVCIQYVNGVLVCQEMIQPTASPEPLILRTGQMELGNWTPAAQEPSHFNGRIDEFAMFSRALSADEIIAYHELKKVIWHNAGQDNSWNNPDNWLEGIGPAQQDAVYIDHAGKDAAVYSEGVSVQLEELRVGSTAGRHGELRITGGTMTASKNSNANSRIGVLGGHGKVSQQGGKVTLNSLQVALDPGSKGTYRLDGGELVITRGVRNTIGSIEIGTLGGTGKFDITGGSLTTRRGVTLGRDGGVGEFSVHGSSPSSIAIGSHKTRDGFWVQHAGSTLRALVDHQGLTPIFIDNIDEDDTGNGDVTFQRDALLEVDFLGAPSTGSWDVMRWEGDLTDHGLRFTDQVDRRIWSFEFVDTDSSGKVDTLRVSARAPSINTDDQSRNQSPAR